jgi:hypothetical protein
MNESRESLNDTKVDNKDQIESYVSQLIKSIEFKQCYNREPYKYFTFDSSVLYARSNTQIKPFIIAHECNERYLDKRDDTWKTRDREFIAFDDIYHYICHMGKYSHGHEVITRGGVLAFDFDITTKFYANSWVAPNFYSQVKLMINKVLSEFYDITTEVKMNWLRSVNDHKYSRHLIIPNIYLICDWSSQLLVFYQICNYIIVRDNMFEYMGDRATNLIDLGIARKNGTLRMPFNSKLNGNPLMIENWIGPESFFESLVEIYDERKDVINIDTNDFNKNKIRSILGITKEGPRKISKRSDDPPKPLPPPQVTGSLMMQQLMKRPLIKDSSNMYLREAFHKLEGITNYISVEVSEGRVKQAIKLMETNKGMTAYRFIKVTDKGILSFRRISSAMCPFGTRIHDTCGGYVIATSSYIKFYCGRGCTNSSGYKYILLDKMIIHPKPTHKLSIPLPNIHL